MKLIFYQHCLHNFGDTLASISVIEENCKIDIQSTNNTEENNEFTKNINDDRVEI